MYSGSGLLLGVAYRQLQLLGVAYRQLQCGRQLRWAPRARVWDGMWWGQDENNFLVSEDFPGYAKMGLGVAYRGVAYRAWPTGWGLLRKIHLSVNK